MINAAHIAIIFVFIYPAPMPPRISKPSFPDTNVRELPSSLEDLVRTGLASVNRRLDKLEKDHLSIKLHIAAWTVVGSAVVALINKLL